MRVAVIGAGPAGARAGGRLARSGHQVVLFDPLAPWEKPCGGGLTTRALELEPLSGSLAPLQTIRSVTIYYGDSSSVALPLSRPLAVVSRKALGQDLLEAAVRLGVDFIPQRISQIQRSGGGWSIRSRNGEEWAADCILGADGAMSVVRRQVGHPLDGSDLSVTMGYLIRGLGGEEMKIWFVPGAEGYLWSFPRPDHLSYGLITRPGPQWTARGKALLENYITADLGSGALEDAEFYSAPVPRLRPRSWTSNRVSGDGWALLGDAAGLVDPITGEGIYYALRSADVLAESFPDLVAYERQIRAGCMRDLERAAALYSRFYSGRFLGGAFRKRMIQLSRRSPTLRRHLEGLVSGRRPYIGLRRALARSAPRVGIELAGLAGGPGRVSG